MRAKIKRCTACGRYTMRDTCPICNSGTRIAHPPKYSPDDKYRHLKARKGREFLEKLRI